MHSPRFTLRYPTLTLSVAVAPTGCFRQREICRQELAQLQQTCSSLPCYAAARLQVLTLLPSPHALQVAGYVPTIAPAAIFFALFGVLAVVSWIRVYFPPVDRA